MVTTHEIENLLRAQKLLLEAQHNEKALPVEGLTCDSREVFPGMFFICKGAGFAPEYLLEAVEFGCAAYMSEKKWDTKKEVTSFLVSDVRRAMAVVSAAFFGYEPGKPKLTGITGTKGKTTTAWYLKAMLDEWQKEKGAAQTGLISSVENFDGKRREDAIMTTPEAPVLYEWIARTRAAGSEYMVIETSSQALKYHRVEGLHFQVGVFLNIAEDHISPCEHRNFEDYFSSKLRIFQQSEIACVNLDSDHWRRILKEAGKAKRVITFGTHPEAQIRYEVLRGKGGQPSFMVTCDAFAERFSLKMRGSFNIENAVAAIAAAYAYGVPVRCMKKALKETVVPGRMEVFEDAGGKVCAIVDYAHNRLSFRRLFESVFQEYKGYKHIITVFGCPGGKAYNRRRELGVLAGMFSDYVYLTSDDPALESASQIAAEVGSYVEMAGAACECVEDRKQAIASAVERAEAERDRTMILILGRGSEKFQKIGRGIYAYPSDGNIVREVMGRNTLLKAR